MKDLYDVAVVLNDKKANVAIVTDGKVFEVESIVYDRHEDGLIINAKRVKINESPT